MPPVKILIVDDSEVIRRLISRVLGRYPGIRVVGTAGNGREALRKIQLLKPDVVTMDVEMPVMDGLTALRRIMRQNPLPVIMFSTLTATGARATIEALAWGAFDFVKKPEEPAALEVMVKELAGQIMSAAAVPAAKTARLPLVPRAPVPAASCVTRGKTRLVVVGASTGGPAALHTVITGLPPDFPAAVVVVQHIPEGFSEPLAEHLARCSRLPVRHAASGDKVLPGQVLVAPAGFDLSFRGRAGSAAVVLKRGPGPAAPGEFHPSVDGVMFSAAQVFGAGAMGVLMTGMGRDGARGMAEIRKRNGRTIAEAESTCIVFGMPKAAIDAGAAGAVVPLPKIASEIVALL
jgi:two-component system chemotaxis response regulator CheB